MTLAQAKGQCEIDADITAHDSLLTECCAEVTDFIEQYLHSTVLETRYILGLEDWSCAHPGYVEIPMGPVMAVNAMSYTDSDGQPVLMDPATDYTLVRRGPGACIVPGYGKGWPANRPHPGSIAIEFTAGYQGLGSPMDASGVPGSITRAAKMLLAHWFENREAILTGTIAVEIPLGMKDALQPYRNYFP